MSSSIDRKLKLQKIQSELKTQYIGQSLYYHEEINSTNSYAKEIACGVKDGCVVLCDNQLSGRGRLNRDWQSVPYKNVCMSVVLKPDIPPAYAARFTIAAAVSLSEALSEFVEDALIKWPNDILVNKRKVAGILLDCTIEGNIVKYVIVGMGINVNTPFFSGELNEVATSLYFEKRKEFAREKVIARILNSLEQNIDLLYSDTGFLELMRKYSAKSYVLGKEVRIIGACSQTFGKVHGFDEQGQIQILTDFGNIVTFNSGDVSLRY